MAEETKLTRALFAHMDEQKVAVDDALNKLGFDRANIEEFKIFCGYLDAVEHFNYQKRTKYRDIPVTMVAEFPVRIVLIIRSNDYIKDNKAG